MSSPVGSNGPACPTWTSAASGLLQAQLCLMVSETKRCLSWPSLGPCRVRLAANEASAQADPCIGLAAT